MNKTYLLFFISCNFIYSSQAEETNLMALVSGYYEDGIINYVSSPVKIDLKSHPFVGEENYTHLKIQIAEFIKRKRRHFRIKSISIITIEDKNEMRKQYQEYNKYEKFNITSLMLRKAQKGYEENPDAKDKIIGKKTNVPRKKKTAEVKEEDELAKKPEKTEPEAVKKSIFDIYD